MSFDSIIANPGRLLILTALASEPQQGFVQLRERTGLTDGNLSTHARRLSTAGMIEIHKSIRDGKPATDMKLTSLGRQSLEDHVQSLLAALKGSSLREVLVGEESISEANAVQDAFNAEQVNSSSHGADWVD
jgi:DNA-binding MarR family transcriptional regulator